MFTINKDKFFTILNDLNKNCRYTNIRDKYYMDIPKFKNILDYIDLNKYTLEYVQNRLITIRPKNLPIQLVRNIIINPIDNKYAIETEECDNITYEFPTTERKTYLTTGNTGGENESYCIKGFMNPAILNTILIYMLNTNLIPNDTMVIFSLKANESKFDADDIIEYLQKYHLDKFNRSLMSVINLDYTSLEKGYPRKGYVGKIIIQSDNPSYSNYALSKFSIVENFDYRSKEGFDIYIKPMPKVKDNYKKILQYFNSPLYIEDRLFIFSDRPINAKYNVLCNSSFLVEWDTIDKYINQLYYYLKRGEF